MSTRRSYKTEALKWKRMALHMHERVCAARYGLSDCTSDVPNSFRVPLVSAVLDGAIKDFERNCPPDDEAGWNTRSV